MNIFFSSSNYQACKLYKTLFPDHQINILLSFGRPSNDRCHFIEARQDNIISFLYLDSGTFTLNYSDNKSGIDISLENYLAYLRRTHAFFDCYFNFDEVHAPEGRERNYDNFLLLKKAGLLPVPVIQDVLGNEIDLYYTEEGCTQMALGSRFSYNSDRAKPIFEKILNLGISVHMFGHTKFSWMVNHPIASVDSSTWHQDSSSGKLRFWHESIDEVDMIDGQDKTVALDLCDNYDKEISASNPLMTHRYYKAFLTYLRDTFGFQLHDLYGDRRYIYREVVNKYYYHTLQTLVTEAHKKKGFPTDVE